MAKASYAACRLATTALTCVTLFFTVTLVASAASSSSIRSSAASTGSVTRTVAPKTATAPPTSSPAPSASPTPSAAMLTASEAEGLSETIWITGAVALLVLGVVFFVARRGTRQVATTDKDLEATRIVYGFWLIIASLLLTLGVVIVTVNIFRPPVVQTSDVIAIITAVTGVIGTLIAAFFGVQAAGAGRSQALSTLEKFQSQTQPAATETKLDPSFGPHAGNTRVTIAGNGFTGASAVNFGAVAGTNFELVNDGLLHVTTPPAPEGTDKADVAVVFPGVTPPNRIVATFYYYTIDASNIWKGQVLIRGCGLTNAAAVMFGTASTPASAPDPSGYLNVTLPDRPANVSPGTEVDVTVEYAVNSPTNVATIGKFTWPKPYAIDVSNIATGQIVIQGSGLTNAVAVIFGAASVPAPAPDANGYLNVTLPDRPADVSSGTEVDVKVGYSRTVDSTADAVTVGKLTWP
jgi:hypothetical protein